MVDPAPEVILASASVARLAMLQNAGVSCRALPASVDEDGLKQSLRAEGADVLETATMLAEWKALYVSRRYPAALVIGADQMLECEGVWFDKPIDREAAGAQLRALRGKTHVLTSVALCAMGGERIWHKGDRATMMMRPFSDEFLRRYLDGEGDAILSSVGAYRLEGWGAQLFSSVQGDHFTILGMPLLPLLDYLRIRGVLAT